MALDDYQLAAVTAQDRRIRVLAGAGSGKTRALVARIEWLVKRQAVRPQEILAITFSRKAAEEMWKRLSGTASIVTIQTIHALGYAILRSERPHFKVADEWKRRKMLREALRETGSLETLGEALIKLTSCKRGSFVVGFGDVRRKYEVIKRKACQWDFDDLLVVAERWLREKASVKSRWCSRYSHILVDEAQDTDLVQWGLIGQLISEHTYVFVVGDISQCHPPGVGIRVGVGRMRSVGTGREKRVEEIRSGDTVCGWNRNAQKLIAGRRVQVASRPYDGEMFRVELDDCRVLLTPNHQLLVRWNLDLAKRVCVTYLMWRQGFGFRVGWCQLLCKQGNGLHLAQRSRIERADAAWILQIHESRAEASTTESIIAGRFGLPTVTFEPPAGAKYLVASNIRAVFTALAGKNFARGQACLAAFGRLFEHPFYRETWERHRGTYFMTVAANVEVGLMKLPLADGVNKWGNVTGIERLPYRGEVFSLDVEKDHLYAADGVVVHNSIYGWRGAQPMEMLHGIDKRFGEFVQYQLPTNYRSLPEVVQLANRTVDGADGALSLFSYRTGVAEIHYRRVMDDAAFVVPALIARNARGMRWGDMAVLYRVNAQSEAFEYQLMSAKVPFVIFGNISFYLRSEIQDVLAYLRLSTGWNNEAADRVYNRPSRYLGRVFKAELDRQGGWQSVAGGGLGGLGFSRGYMGRCLLGFYRLVSRLQQMWRDRFKPHALVQVVYDNGYWNWLLGEEPDDADEMRAENLKALLGASRRYERVEDLLAHADACASHDLGHASGQRGDRVQLLTIHKAKGQEWPLVCLVGCNEGLLPHQRGDWEEERRLFYVAVTRAQDELLITSSGKASCFVKDYVVGQEERDAGKSTSNGSEGGGSGRVSRGAPADDPGYATAGRG